MIQKAIRLKSGHISLTEAENLRDSRKSAVDLVNVGQLAHVLIRAAVISYFHCQVTCISHQSMKRKK